MDINKIQFFSITNNDISTRVYLTLEEDDTVSVKIDNPLNSIAYPLLTISYKLRYTENNLFTQNKDYFLVINGQATKIDLIDISYSDDSVTVSFLIKKISAIEVYKTEIFDIFFDANGLPKLQTIVAGGTKFVIPRHTEEVIDYLMTSSYDDFHIIADNIEYLEDDEIGYSEATALWNDKNIFVRNLTKNTLNTTAGAVSPSMGDEIRVFNFFENEQNKYDNIPNTQIVSTSQFGNILSEQGNLVTSILNIIPDEMYVNCTTEMVDVTISGITFLIPCILLCKQYKLQTTTNVVQRGWYIIPLIKEFNYYVKRISSASLLTALPAVGTVFCIPEYRATLEPLPYYSVGGDVNNSMYNGFIQSGSNGLYTPIVYSNKEVSVYDIISDICYLKRDVIINNNFAKSLPIYSLTEMKQVLNNSSYVYKADDLKLKNIDFIDNDIEGFCIVDKNQLNKQRRVTQYTNCVMPLQMPRLDINGEKKMRLLTTSGANFSDKKYNSYKEIVKANAGILQYKFEGYLSTISNTSIDLRQNMIPKSFIYNNTEFHLLGVDNYNIRTGYIKGICYSIRS